jgi:hypothetical protein
LDELKNFRRPFANWPSPTPAVYHVTGRFHANPTKFKAKIDGYRKAMQRFQVIEPNKAFFYDKFPDEILQDPIYEPHLTFLKKDPTHPSRRGGGYWFWKGPLMLHHLQHDVREGDFLVYADTDMLDHFVWLPNVLEFMVEEDQNLVMYQIPQKNRLYTKSDVYHAYCGGTLKDQLRDQRNQFAASFVIIRKDKATMQLTELWKRGTQTYHFINDDPSTMKNVPLFREHRHDQSIITLILHCLFQLPPPRYYPHTCLNTWTLNTYKLQPLEVLPDIRIETK